MSCLINLDEHKEPFVSFEIIDDVRNVCRSVSVQFISSKQLDFNGDNDWFTAFDTDWCPTKIKETTDNSQWSYEMVAVPRKALSEIKSVIRTTRDLANHLNLTLSDDSVPLQFPIPMLNKNAITFLSKARGQSTIMNKNDFKKSMMVYFDSSVMISKVMSNIIDTKSEVYENTSELIEGVTFFDSRNDRNHHVDMFGVKAQTARDIFNSHIGRCVVIQSSVPAQILKNYQISMQDRNLPKMMCIAVDMNLLDQPQVYMNTFVEFI